MPLPKPKPQEEQKKFIQRCMIDAEMIKEFRSVDQRYAVCSQIYRDERS